MIWVPGLSMHNPVPIPHCSGTFLSSVLMIFKDLPHLTQICFTAALPGLCRPTNLVSVWVYQSLAQTWAEQSIILAKPRASHCTLWDVCGFLS